MKYMIIGAGGTGGAIGSHLAHAGKDVTFIGLVREISGLADAMGIGFGEDVVPVNLKITDESDPTATTSMQKDIAAGRPSEIDGLIYEVVRMGERCGVDTPCYSMVAEEMRARGL